jgi:filamentous hemagglutinin family protein
MNKQLYKIIFSKRLGTLVAVGEHATSAGKAASGQGCRGTVVADGFLGVLRLTFASVALACLSLGTQAQSTVVALASTALPQGGSVSTGSAAISTNGANMAITQSTDKASINWQSFNIGSAASVSIAQPSSSAVLLNRVVGNDPSQILGKLTANGQVILLNPNGVLFGKDGSVTASAFTASTFGLSDADFMAGYYKYNRNGSTAAVVNQGTIETSAGGFVALIGATVTNEGRIIAPQGDVVLAAAESVTLPEDLVKPKPAPTPSTVGVRMSKRVRLELDPAAVNTAVNNTESGVIVTDGGQVLLQAAAISSAVASVCTSSGCCDGVGR